jgi:hypothetical protein
MRRSFRHLRLGFVLPLVVGACLFELSMMARAGQPKIDFIERFQTNYVTIHFDTEANLTYELQYTETLTTNGMPGGTWTNLFVSPNIDSPNHYVVVDTGTRPQRFYRLRVTP